MAPTPAVRLCRPTSAGQDTHLCCEVFGQKSLRLPLGVDTGPWPVGRVSPVHWSLSFDKAFSWNPSPNLAVLRVLPGSTRENTSVGAEPGSAVCRASTISPSLLGFLYTQNSRTSWLALYWYSSPPKLYLLPPSPALLRKHWGRRTSGVQILHTHSKAAPTPDLMFNVGGGAGMFHHLLEN